jgi:hypothetical protein
MLLVYLCHGLLAVVSSSAYLTAPPRYLLQEASTSAANSQIPHYVPIAKANWLCYNDAGYQA